MTSFLQENFFLAKNLLSHYYAKMRVKWDQVTPKSSKPFLLEFWGYIVVAP